MHPADGICIEDVLHGGEERAEDGAGVDDDDGVAGLREHVAVQLAHALKEGHGIQRQGAEALRDGRSREQHKTHALRYMARVKDTHTWLHSHPNTHMSMPQRLVVRGCSALS
jgi:hypothetical protein